MAGLNAQLAVNGGTATRAGTPKEGRPVSLHLILLQK